MRRHAKASSASTNWAQADRLASLQREMLATRGARSGSDGRIAPAARLMVVFALTLALLAIFTASALAAETRPYTGVTFGPDGVGGTGTFSNLQSVAVDQTSGDVFAYDAGAGKVYKFDAAGAPIAFSGLAGSNAIEGIGGTIEPGAEEVAVAPQGSPGGTAGDIYVANNQVVKVYAPSGVELGTLGEGETCGVAVDPTGHVFIGSYSSAIREYVPSASPPTNADQTGEGTVAIQLCDVAADGAGSIYAANYAGGEIAKLAGITDTNPVLIEPGGPTLGVDPASDDLLVDRGGEVVEYDAAGAQKGAFGTNQLGRSYGVAVNHAANAVYVGNGGSGKVKVFGETTVLPDVSAEAATGVRGTKATLHGVVNPDGVAITKCEFEYGTTPALGESKACTEAIPTDEGDHAVTAPLTGLAGKAGYFFRLSATNANGTNVSSELGFTTLELAVTKPASDITAKEAILNGIVLPEGEAVNECFFEYGETEAYGGTEDCEQSVPSDEGEHTVSAVIAGLVPSGATYHFRLVIARPGGESKGGDQSFQTEGALVASERTGSAGVSEALVEADINPRGSLTKYRFDYGETESYGSSTSEAILGEGNELETIAETLSGLTPETTYHWRVVTINDFGEFSGADRTFTTRSSPLGPETGCPNQSFRTSTPSEHLPDCRVYEQASPTDKNGANIQHDVGLIQASPDGERITFVDNAGLPSTGGSGEFYVASRLGNQWSTNGMVPNALHPGRLAELLGWDEEIRTPVSIIQGSALYMGDTGTGTYEEIVPLPSFFSATIAGYAADSEELVFESGQALPVPGAEEGVSNVYALDHGSLSLVDRVPQGTEVTCDDAGVSACIPAPGGGSAPQHAISSDGSKVVFRAVGTSQLYIREGGTKTTRISASKRIVPEEPKPPKFVGATPDDSQVLFMSCEKLTEDSTAVSTPADSCTEFEEFRQGNPTNKQGMDLYRYEPGSGALTDLTVDHEAGDPLGAAVVGLLGASENGSYVYFAANGVLGNGSSEGASPGNCKPEGSQPAGSCNIYLEHDGVISFVSRIDSAGGNVGLGGKSAFGSAENWQRDGPNSAQVNRDGILLFGSTEDLTGYDSSCVLPGTQRHSCTEWYRYLPSSKALNCVSCNPTGAAPTGDATLVSRGSVFGTGIRTSVLTRNLSADGNRVFFDTPDSLVAADTNGVNDPYEWEADGTGSCRSTKQGGGCLYILSTGTSDRSSYFGDASVSGNDAFIFTNQQLVPQDKDDLTDVYDVRVEGGLASQYTTPAVPCSSGEACRGAGTGAPSESSPGTLGFSGPSNQVEKPKTKCKKRNEKCKRKQKHKKQKKKGKQRESGTKAKPRLVIDNRGGSK